MNRLYTDLAPWFHDITHPDDYRAEAEHIGRLIDAAIDGEARTLMELGAGGGNNALHLKRRFACTLTDLSPAMLDLSQSINPECAHVVGDMRALRLGETFDVVLAHDALDYMLTVDDLHAAIATAAIHCRPGGVAVFIPDVTAETFAPGTTHGGTDRPDGGGARFLEWTHPLGPGETVARVDYALILKTPGKATEIASDTHRIGVFPQEVWLDGFARAGLTVLDIDADDPHTDEHVVFVTRRDG